MDKELSPEQIVLQEVEATMWTMGWQYLVDDWKAQIKELEEWIHDPSLDDIPKYSLRSLLVVKSNMLTTVSETPAKLLNLYKSNEK